MIKKYRNPPIVDAVCEFRFAPDSPWDLAHPGLIYSELQEHYPRRISNPPPQELISISVGGSAVSPPPPPFQELRFWRQDSEDGVIVVATNRLAIAKYPPYRSCESFLGVIQESYQTYLRVAEPKSLERVGLRYINEFAFDFEPVNLNDFFEYYPHLGPDLPQDYAGTQIAMDFLFRDKQDRARLLLGVSPVEGSITVRLDIDYFPTVLSSVPLQETTNWLNYAHSEIGNLFEGCLTDATREMCGGEI